VDEKGEFGSYPVNPNGSIDHIAGICDSSGRILGLMPHPERHIQSTQGPHWTRGTSETGGLKLFAKAVNYFC
jgi:phosphoribosylformylglycinamidine synthase